MASWVGKVTANRARLLEDLHRLRSFGAVNYIPTARGGDGIPKGVVRPALSAADIEAREWLMERASAAGLTPSMDRLGTTLALGNCRDPAQLRLLAGSHSDTQPTGGWLDGALGVVFALEAARAVAEAGGPNAVDVINFQDEEGRFGSLTGSSAVRP
jgi:beta-ureidopropionase / N-carbamoyl-L-amino-acid hydrolase